MKQSETDQSNAVCLAITSIPELWGRRLAGSREIQEWVNSIVKSRWFKARFEIHGVVVHEHQDKDESGRCWMTGDEGHISLDVALHFELFVLDMLAVVLTGDNHGRFCCRQLLELVGRFISPKSAALLRLVFVKMDIKHKLPPVHYEDLEYLDLL